MGSRSGFGMILDGKGRDTEVPDPLHRSVIEVDMCDLHLLA